MLDILGVLVLGLGFFGYKKNCDLKGMSFGQFSTPEKFGGRRSCSDNWVGGKGKGVAANGKCEILKRSIRSGIGKNNIAEDMQVFNSNARSVVKKLSN